MYLGAKIIYIKIQNKIEENLRENQFSLRKERGTRKAILT